MRKFIVIAITATTTFCAASAAQAQQFIPCRLADGRMAQCMNPHYRRPPAHQLRVGAVSLTGRTTYTGPAQTDPARAVPYAGAVQPGHCNVRGAVPVKDEDNTIEGCVGTVTDRRVMEQHRLPIAQVCEGKHGTVRVDLNDGSGGIANYPCP